MVLRWPVSHTGWRLEREANPLEIGYSTNWTIVPGSDEVNLYQVPLTGTAACGFYRLAYP